MLKCQNCGNKGRGTVSAICRKCGYLMLPIKDKYIKGGIVTKKIEIDNSYIIPLDEEKYKKMDKEIEEIKENGDR